MSAPLKPPGTWFGARRVGRRSYDDIVRDVAAVEFVTAEDGVRVAFTIHGDGPTVVFASNVFGDAFANAAGFAPVRAVTDGLVGLGWRVVRYDVRGMGRSARNVANPSVAGRTRDLDAVIAAVGQPAVLAALDHGAATAITHVAAHPTSTARLVLINPWRLGGRRFLLADVRMTTSTPPTSDEEWQVFSTVRGHITSAHGPVTAEEVSALLDSCTSHDDLFRFYDASRSADLTRQLAAIISPTLVVQDHAFPFGSIDLCHDVAAHLVDSRLVELRHGAPPRPVPHRLRGSDRPVWTARNARPLPFSGHHADRWLDGLNHARSTSWPGSPAGLGNKQIAAELGISVATVERHLVGTVIARSALVAERTRRATSCVDARSGRDGRGSAIYRLSVIVELSRIPYRR